MILYKYVGFKTGQAIVSNNTMSFTLSKYFNDPFELSAAYGPSTPLEEGDNILDKIKIFGKNVWKKIQEKVSVESYGILSLTRSALNPLMWAHYSENHRGFVIGINVDDKVFTSPSMNRIPVQYGSIIYTESKPSAELLSQAASIEDRVQMHEFDSGQLEFFQRLFLYKPMYWGYEEEVRVVKHIMKAGKDDCPSGDFRVKTIGGTKRYLLVLPTGSIKEIYLGLRNPLLKNEEERAGFMASARRYGSRDLLFYKCVMGENTWGLDKEAI